MVTERNTDLNTANQFDTAVDIASKTLTYTPATKTIDNVTGDESFTNGTPTTIQGILYRKEDIWNIKKFGELHGADAVLVTKRTLTLARMSLVSYEGVDYRIKNTPIIRKKKDEALYNVVHLFET